MNETDFIRQQLATERSHLREILTAVRHGAPGTARTGAVTLYLDWAGPRLVQQLAAHRAALRELATGACAGQLDRLAAALEGTATGPAERAQRADQLLELLESWTGPLDTFAVQALRIAHWRQAAHLSADSILEERQLYAAARTAVGLP